MYSIGNLLCSFVSTSERCHAVIHFFVKSNIFADAGCGVYMECCEGIYSELRSSNTHPFFVKRDHAKRVVT